MIVGYSVLQYQLLDVRVTMNRSTAKAVRLLFIFLAGLSAQLVLWLINKEAYNFYSFFGGLVALMIGAACAALLFPRLFGVGSEGVERRILGDTFEYQDQVRKFIETLTWYSEMPRLLDDVHDLFTRVFHLESYALVLRTQTNLAFEVVRSHPADFAREISALRPQSAVFQYFEWTKSEYLPVGADDTYIRTSPLAKQAREQLSRFEACYCFPLASEGESIGLLLVGPKSKEQFTAADIGLLIGLVKSLSLMVNQIRLKNQILQAQELDLLGRMSRGMAHDLNNLLTPVWTILQLANESGANTLDDELLPVALRNIKTMRAYIREALFFSENLRPDFQLGRLDMLVRQAGELAKTSRKKQVDVIAETPGEVLAEVDEVLLQRMIANLVANAIDASPEGSEIHIELTRLEKTDASRDWVRVRIIDRGEGIKKEDLNRVFTPYFTTKNRGDENRGFGLGLAICRKIVHLHGGNLSIASQVKKGTTVQVDLPTRQTKSEPAVLTASA
jgi:signal transduction histidine kinase